MSVDHTLLQAAWQRAVGSGPPAMRLFESLLARHREPHRHYHGVRHVARVVADVQRLAVDEPVVDLDAVIVAACFHDAVHRPDRRDDHPDDHQQDEEASAELARRSLSDLDDPNWPDARACVVADMVRATAHFADPPDPDAGPDAGPGASRPSATVPATDVAVLLDADLAILGADTAAYAAYVTGIRAEYAHLGPDEWRSGRRAVLDLLLARPELYRTTSARQWWGARARANLTAERATLD